LHPIDNFMQKYLYILFILCLTSCSGNDDSSENQFNDSALLEPNKILTYYAELPTVGSLNPNWYYEFFYENGKLKRMNGKLVKQYNGIEMFFNNPYSTLSYSANQVIIEHSETDGDIKKVINTFDNDRLKKSEMYSQYNELIAEKNFSYEADKISVHTHRYSWDTYDTYYFNSAKNLIKSEKLEKSSNVSNKLTTTYYSNFDTAKNPYKKLYLMNENFFVKSLSANNYRKISYTIEYLQNPQSVPGNGSSEWTYNYDSSGQVIIN
jgi:hypothetical protein